MSLYAVHVLCNRNLWVHNRACTDMRTYVIHTDEYNAGECCVVYYTDILCYW